jgi:hypothetical protein
MSLLRKWANPERVGTSSADEKICKTEPSTERGLTKNIKV